MDGIDLSVTGVQAGLARFDLVANNIANLLTPGFKPARADQVAIRGGGTAVVGTQVLFSQGPIDSEQGFALAIQGDGFFQLDTPQGLRFARGGDFHVDAAGNLVNTQGLPVSPPVQVPASAQSILVTRDGRVLALFGDGTILQVGLVELASVANPAGLAQEGGSLFSPTPASGPPQGGATGEIVFGALEGSATDLFPESLDSFLARAAVRANLSALKVQDQTQGDLLDILG